MTDELKEVWWFFRNYPGDAWGAIKRGASKGWYGETWEETKRKMDVAVLLIAMLCLTVIALLLAG